MSNLSPKRVKALIDGGENSIVDFKESLFDYSDGKQRSTHHSELVKDLSAFANSDGGYLIIGVSDDGQVVGFHSSDELEQKIINLCRDISSPPLRPKLHKLKISDKDILVIEIEKGLSDLHMIRGRIYIRVHNEVRQASSAELTDIILRRNHNRMRELLHEKDSLSNMIIQVSRLSTELFKTHSLLGELEYHDYCQGRINPKNVLGLDMEQLLHKSESLLTNLDSVDVTRLSGYLAEVEEHTQLLEKVNVQLENDMDNFFCFIETKEE